MFILILKIIRLLLGKVYQIQK